MRTVLTAVVLSCGALAAVHAQQGPVSDSAPATGTHVRFWSHRVASQGWLDGVVIRFFPPNGGKCLGVHSEVLAGFISIQEIDSLQVAVPAPSSGAPGAHGASTASPTWRKVPVAPLRAGERGCTS